MSESTLSLSRSDILGEMAYTVGWGRDPGDWDVDQETRLEINLARGLRNFYNAHDWNFLEPTSTINVFGTVTGTTSGASTTTITATTASFYPSMIGMSFVFDTSENSYTISGYTSSTVITVSSTAAGEASDDTFTITSGGDFRLPDDFGYLRGNMTFPANDSSRNQPIEPTNEEWIRVQRQSSDVSGQPTHYAIRPVAFSTSVGQRQEVMLWPTPDQAYALKYAYKVLPDTISSDSDYPYGGMMYAEAILASCRSSIELDINDNAAGPHTQDYQRQLAMCIKNDARQRPQKLGYNGNGGSLTIPRSWHTVTYNGVSY